MNKYLILGIVILCFLCPNFSVYGQDNYMDYHTGIIKCEKLITASKFKEAIDSLDSLFNRFDFIFLRDCKVATELSAFEKDIKSGIRFMRLGILNGWTLKSIKKNDKFSLFNDDPHWKNLLSEYDSLHNRYLESLNVSLRNQVHEMFKKDQKKALGALIRIGEKSKVKYAEKKFAPQSEKQLDQLNEILDQQGYPGEQFIGNNWWTSVILSHHNSISVDYNSKDTLYSHIKPKLMNALKNGEVSPYELVIIEDWRTAALNGHKLTSYGFLGAISNDSVLEIVNKNRSDIGIRSIELRNNLIDIEKETRMNLYLPKGWQKGKITVASNG